MIFMFILLVSLVAVVGVAMFISRTAEHGEARFDSHTGKPSEKPETKRSKDAVPEKRLNEE